MFDQIILPNGLRVVGEKLTHVRSCTVGVWVKVGSRNESLAENGLSHFLEHMFFRRGRRFYRLYSIEKGESKKQFVVRLRYLALKDDYPLLFTLPQDENEPEHHLSGCDPQELYEYIVSNELNPHQPVRTTDQDVMSIGQIHTINYKYLRHLALAISDTISVYASGRVALYNRFAKKYPYICVGILRNYAFFR